MSFNKVFVIFSDAQAEVPQKPDIVLHSQARFYDSYSILFCESPNMSSIYTLVRLYKSVSHPVQRSGRHASMHRAER